MICIIGQNFNLDCTKLTEAERQRLQSYNKIIIWRENDSADYPVLAPPNVNLVIAATVRCKTGYKTENVKVTIASNAARNQITYDMPASFRQDDNSQNNLAFSSNEWVHHIGVNIKDY